MMPTVYLAQPMGGRMWSEVWREAHEAKFVLKKHKLDSWSPSLKEAGLCPPHSTISTTKQNLKKFWRQDLTYLHECDALLSLRGDLVSEGVGLEIGIAKYVVGIPVVVICDDKNVGRVTHIEADHVASNLSAAARWLKGYFRKRA